MIVQIRDLDENIYSKIVAFKAKKGLKKLSQALKLMVEEWETKK